MSDNNVFAPHESMLESYWMCSKLKKIWGRINSPFKDRSRRDQIIDGVIIFVICAVLTAVWIRVGGCWPFSSGEQPTNIVDANDAFGRTRVYENLRKSVSALEYQIIDERIEPWVFFRVTGVKVTKFNGKVMSYQGGGEFSGAPLLCFWTGFIEPFLEHGIADVLNAVSEDCHDRGIDREEFVAKAQSRLSGLIWKTYNRMADVDKRLRKGTDRVDVTAKAREMDVFLRKYAKAVVQDTEPPRMRSD